jgi:hypothetical protein
VTRSSKDAFSVEVRHVEGMMNKTMIGMVLGLAGLSMAASGCVVRGYARTPTVHGSAHVGVHSSQTYTVQAYPPDPLYEEVAVSPGYGHVWIDGYWHWNGYRWVWIGGRWMPERVGYVYVSPYYDYVDGRYVYRSGYWSHRDRLPRNVRVYDHRDGRPATYVPPRRDTRYDYRPGVRDHRSYQGRPPATTGPRDHRSGGGTYQPPSGPRDHRGTAQPPSGPRDHRSGGGTYQPPSGPRDHRGTVTPRPPAADPGPARDHRGGGRPGGFDQPRPPAADPGGRVHPTRPTAPPRPGERPGPNRPPAVDPDGKAKPTRPTAPPQAGERPGPNRPPAADPNSKAKPSRDHRDKKKPNHY